MANTNPARGMRDFLPSDIRKRNYVINIIKEVYESYGFEPLETPAVENIETLMGKYGEEGNQLIFKILKRGEHEKTGEADLALRYDLTVPTARVIANNKNELPKFFKRYQIQPVWRADRPARGRFREFYQCDVDAIGSKSMVVEAELCGAVSEVLTRLGFTDFKIRANDRRLLTKILNAASIPLEMHIDALVSLDKLDKVGSEGVRKEFLNRGIGAESFDKIDKLYSELAKPQPIDQIIARIGEYIGRSSFDDEYTDLDFNMFFGFFDCQNESIIDGNLKNHILYFDVTLARGLSYYTGAIFEIVLTNGDFAGSIGGGGRYDGLIGMFGKEEIPACGFSLGLERIIVVMTERGMFPPELEQNSADVMVTIWNEESIAESLKLASELRKSGLRVLVYPEADKMGKQFKYAGQINVPYVCVMGENELAENKVSLKNMTTGEQEIVAREEVATKIKN